MSCFRQNIVSFYRNIAWFGFCEQLGSIASAMTGLMIFPFFVFLMGALWKGFNQTISTFSFNEVIVYITINEMLFITFIRNSLIGKSTGNFTLLLARPRSWIGINFANVFGKTIGNRLIYIPIIIVLFLLYGISLEKSLCYIFKILLFLPLVTVISSLYNLFLAVSQLRWHQVEYVVLPLSKIFLVFGGVFVPLIDYAENYRKILLYLPPSDLFFQPAHYIIKGSFYGMSTLEWCIKIAIQILVLIFFIIKFFNSSKKHYQSYGG
jgi:hypothetical protein